MNCETRIEYLPGAPATGPFSTTRSFVGDHCWNSSPPVRIGMAKSRQCNSRRDIVFFPRGQKEEFLDGPVPSLSENSENHPASALHVNVSKYRRCLEPAHPKTPLSDRVDK